MELLNQTPFAVERVVHQDAAGRDLLVVVVKATYTLARADTLVLAEQQLPVQRADEHHGDPDASSVRIESDLAPVKQGTDVVLSGHAYAPRGRAAEVHVSLRVGPLHQVVAVFGDRRWRSSLGISSPEPFEKMPLVYELAFGGKDTSPADPRHHEVEARNPVGRGFRARHSRLEPERVPLPNLEDPQHLLRSPDDRPAPAGFGVIARAWQPRVAHAGTFDEAWARSRSPLPPADFDERFHSGAHPRLWSPRHLGGDELCEVAGVSPLGVLRFRLPGARPRAEVTIGKARHAVALAFDTLLLWPDEDRVAMVWRGARLLAQKELFRVKTVQVT